MLRKFVLVLTLTTAACAAQTPSDDTDSTTDDLRRAGTLDGTATAKAKQFFQDMLERGTNRDAARIPYDALPPALATKVEAGNPDVPVNATGSDVGSGEWSDKAFEFKVEDATGARVTIYGLVDGISDEGESFQLYDLHGTLFASGDDYRAFAWDAHPGNPYY